MKSIRKISLKKIKKPVKKAFFKKANFNFISNLRKINQIKKVLDQKEILAIYFFIFLIIASSIFLAGQFYLSHTKVIPEANGHYIEGVAGEPRYVNPILCQTNEADEDLVTLIFSSLFSYDSEGRIVLDLAENYAIGDFGKIYDVTLRKDVFWHDGPLLTADDVIFTVHLIQDPNYKSPLRTAWQSIEVEKIDEFTVRFKLEEPYAPFLSNLTFGILPQHIWEYITPSKFPLTEYNLKPVGSGPYKFVKFVKDKEGKVESFELEVNRDYEQSPFIGKITFRFYPNEDEILAAYNQGEILGFNYLDQEKLKQIKNIQNLNLYEINIPRFFACFLNQNKSKALADKTVRLALAYATDKDKLIETVLDGKGLKIETPLLPYFQEYNPNTKVYEFAPEHARNILEAAGWQDKDGDGIREKDDIQLKFKLTTSQWPALIKTVEEISKMWQEIGVAVEPEYLSISEITQNSIRPREYEILLFGEVIGSDPDPYSYWHSSQRKDPGLNLALYSNEEVDKLLEESRTNLDPQIRIEKYQKFQEIVVDDVPAVFLYSPLYIYGVNKKVKGIEIKNVVLPSKRFSQIEDWYIETKRVWK